MTAIVCFRTPVGLCALAVDQVSEVRLANEVSPLPVPRPGVAGVVPNGDDAVSVLSVLGSTGDHVLVVDDHGLTFGLLVDRVLAVEHVQPERIGPPPPGQDRAVVAGILRAEGELVMLLDLAVLRGRLVG